MNNNYVKIFVLVTLYFLSLLLLIPSASLRGNAAPFSGGEGVPSIIGEIACYGEDELNPLLMAGLREVYKDVFFSSKKFSIRSVDYKSDLMKKVHLEAIVRGHLYDKGESNAELIRYAQNALGRNFRRSDKEEKELFNKRGTPYKLSHEVASELKEYSMNSGIKYFIFCNIHSIDVFLINSEYARRDVSKDLRGKRLDIDMEYYLVDGRTGFVYDGFSHESKTAEMMQSLFVSSGKGMPINMLFQRVIEEQVKDVVSDLGDRGFERLEKLRL